MKTGKIIITIALGLLFMPAVQLSAQSRSETNLYKKTIRKPSVKAADKFLKKYPSSVYSIRIQQMKDSLLYLDFVEKNVSRIPHEEALRLSGTALDAIGWKKDGVEHILALDGDFTLRILTPSGALEETRTLPPYTMEDAPARPVLAGPMEIVTPFGGQRQLIHFAYRNGDSEYVEALYQPEENLLSQAIFYGTPLPDGRIEGQSPEMMEGVIQTAEIAWLAGRFRENESLVALSHEDYLTDTAIQWWRKKNPKAETTATKLSFGALDPESSLVASFRKATKEKGKSVNAAQFDLRGYTVIVTQNRKTGDFALIWCEPVCRNRKTDKYLDTIYFESDGTTLDLIYYKGRTTHKIKISLPSQALRHLK